MNKYKVPVYYPHLNACVWVEVDAPDQWAAVNAVEQLYPDGKADYNQVIMPTLD